MIDGGIPPELSLAEPDDGILPESGDEAPSWEQQPEEPESWYRQFLAYRDLGHGRTINAARDLAYKVAGLELSRGHAGSTWISYAKRFHWARRAADWDAYQESREAVRLEVLRREERNRRIDLARSLEVLVSREIERIGKEKNLPPMDWNAMIKVLAFTFASLRQDLGEQVPNAPPAQGQGVSVNLPQMGRGQAIIAGDLQRLLAGLRPSEPRPVPATIRPVRRREQEDDDDDERAG